MFTLMQSKEMQKINNNKIPPKTSLSKHDTKAGKNGAADAIKNIDDIEELDMTEYFNREERFLATCNENKNFFTSSIINKLFIFKNFTCSWI